MHSCCDLLVVREEGAGNFADLANEVRKVAGSFLHRLLRREQREIKIRVKGIIMRNSIVII
jgi:hypothetical protein